MHFLRPELTETLKAFRPAEAKAGDWAFRGQVPHVPTFKRDLAAAGIPFEDERGRRVDLHALRTTFGALLSASGVSPRVTTELMRHSDPKLTNQTYMDVSRFPMASAINMIPAFGIAAPKDHTQKRTQLADFDGHSASRSATDNDFSEVDNSPENKGESHALSSSVTERQKGENGSKGRTRTYNRSVNSRLLYH